jgi:hypothetical protein
VRTWFGETEAVTRDEGRVASGEWGVGERGRGSYQKQAGPSSGTPRDDSPVGRERQWLVASGEWGEEDEESMKAVVSG